MEILIYGATEVAFLLATRLHDSHNITLISEEPPTERFSNLDVSLVTGSCSDIPLLETMEVGKMELFIACSKLDEANVVACWTLKRFSDIETICFLSKAELCHNVVSQNDSKYHVDYDIDTVIWPEELLVQDIFRIISVPNALDVESLAGNNDAQMFEYRIAEESRLAGRRVMECGFPKGVLIAGVIRNSEMFIPDGSTIVEAEDKVFFIGSKTALNSLAADFFRSRNQVKRVAIIGGGSVGFMLAQLLEDAMKVKLIEVSPERCEFLANTLKSTLVLQGDGTDLELLESEEIANSDACICITNNDEKNLLCSLLIKQLGAERIITRVGTMQNYRLFEHVGIDVVVSPKASALTEVINRVQAHDVNVVALLEGGRGEILSLALPDDFASISLHEIKLPAQAVIGVVARGGQVIIPDGMTMLHPGDNIKIFAMRDDAEKLKEFFG